MGDVLTANLKTESLFVKPFSATLGANDILVFLLFLILCLLRGVFHHTAEPVVRMDYLIEFVSLRLGILSPHLAQAFAAGAPALRGIEGESMRSRVLVTKSCSGAHKAAGVVLGLRFFAARLHYHHHAVALCKRAIHRLTNTFHILVGVALPDTQPVYHHFDGMVAVAVKFHTGGYLFYLAVNTHIDIALVAYALKEFFIMTFAVFDKRCENINAPVGIVGGDKV